MESKVDEMFKKLGYEISPLRTKAVMVANEYYNRKSDTIITFWADKEVSKYNEYESDYITMQELQAINEKVKELGWIK